MSRAAYFGTLLFASPFLNTSWAQEPTVPAGSNMTFQWNYSCLSGKDCSFSCPGSGGASHVTKLVMNLGTISVGSNQAPAVFYEFSTREIPRANGFSISTGLGTLSCQVNGMTLDYSGPPKIDENLLGKVDEFGLIARSCSRNLWMPGFGLGWVPVW